jgi:hypothetical protein
MATNHGTMQPVYESSSAASRVDLLRRFAPTIHATNLVAMQRTVRVETNNLEMLALVLKFFERHQHSTPSVPEFVWRIILESDNRLTRAGRDSPPSPTADFAMSILDRSASWPLIWRSGKEKPFWILHLFTQTQGSDIARHWIFCFA